VELHVLADERDLDLALEPVDPLDERAPLVVRAARRAIPSLSRTSVSSPCSSSTDGTR
jgi:hypothetical protein